MVSIDIIGLGDSIQMQKAKQTFVETLEKKSNDRSERGQGGNTMSQAGVVRGTEWCGLFEAT